ncbi:MAG: exodeoxyribonuclease III [Victivallales bacterium]|nr:exodeoxyribonuclease III [Victivallales bacterium]
MKMASFNVNGIRAAEKKGLLEWISTSGFDIVSLQETKIHEDQLTDSLRNIEGFTSYWTQGEKRGYSGVANYVRNSCKPTQTAHGFGLESRFDNEGRILISEFDAFTHINIYFPNGQKDEERLQYKLDFYDATLEYCESRRKEGRELIICGDYNTAHNEIDLARPKANENTSGFLRIERDWMDKFEHYGYIDTFRHFNPDTVKYSWWSYRAGARGKNVGWRLDYFYITPGLLDKVRSTAILNDIDGSDHCPVAVELK